MREAPKNPDVLRIYADRSGADQACAVCKFRAGEQTTHEGFPGILLGPALAVSLAVQTFLKVGLFKSVICLNYVMATPRCCSFATFAIKKSLLSIPCRTFPRLAGYYHDGK